MWLPPGGPDPREVTTQSEGEEWIGRGRTTCLVFRMEENSRGLVASSVWCDTADASALRVRVSGLRECNLTTDRVL